MHEAAQHWWEGDPPIMRVRHPDPNVVPSMGIYEGRGRYIIPAPAYMVLQALGFVDVDMEKPLRPDPIAASFAAIDSTKDMIKSAPPLSTERVLTLCAHHETMREIVFGSE